MSEPESIRIQFHPRAFAAFGEELVTSDSVAVLELVKNSYDAYALSVEICFDNNEKGEPRIIIKDDGLGMTKSIIVNAWATIATPYKKKNPVVKRVVNGIERTRIVSGNKGLGRFSAARLGRTMTMITKTQQGPVMKAFFDWDVLNNLEDVEQCRMTLETLDEDRAAGTTIIIEKLRDRWDDEDKIGELTDELSRLITPFEEISDFDIHVVVEGKNTDLHIKPQPFIDNPVYRISGNVNQNGLITYSYSYDNGNRSRKKDDTIEWSLENYIDRRDVLSEKKEIKPYSGGPFSFEIRAWDTDPESLGEVSSRFGIGKRDIKTSIKMYKGISVYRDSVLVLPKSDAGRDWLGLDAKRIIEVGRRISTNQVIGIVKISNKLNPEIKDTTDREKLADTLEYKQFINVMQEVVDALQRERNIDKEEGKKGESLSEILTPLSSGGLVETAELAVENGADATEIVKYIKDYHEKNEQHLLDLNERLVYYAQTASLGTVSVVIMHEMLTGLNYINRFIDRVRPYMPDDKRTKEYYELAVKGQERIIEVTNSFAPLCNRELRKTIEDINLRNAIEDSFKLISAKKISDGVILQNTIDESLKVRMTVGELQTVFINLFDNACYWMQKNLAEKTISVVLEESNDKFYRVSINDNGIGIKEENSEKVFVPGVTSKPKGIGMGLVIVTEIVKAYGGNVCVIQPGKIGGASLVVDLPMAK